MSDSESPLQRYPLLATPHVRLQGTVDDAMYQNFRDQLLGAPSDGPLVVTLSTLGGDPEVARLMADELRLLGEATGRELLFLGKVAVYSAGATFMSGFPVDKRFLTRGTRLMLHERQMHSSVDLSGFFGRPVRTAADAAGDPQGQAQRDRAFDRDRGRGLPRPCRRIARRFRGTPPPGAL